MPAFETMDLYQAAVFWERTGIDTYGQPLIEDPVEIRVRWNDKRRQVLQPNGTLIAYDASLVTDREIPDGSILWKGELDEMQGTSFVPTTGLLYEAKSLDNTSDIKNRFSRTEVTLMRYNGTLPGRTDA